MKPECMKGEARRALEILNLAFIESDKLSMPELTAEQAKEAGVALHSLLERIRGRLTGML